jgi:CheY-like chemotaxis protein
LNGDRRPLSVRVGISSGDVTTVDGDCFGRAVVEASRLCARARGGQILVAESSRLLAAGYEGLVELGTYELKGLPELMRVWEATWSPVALAPLRAVLADDAVLVREGVARVLEAAGIEVVGQAGDANRLLSMTAELRPDLAIVDVRMPPTHTTEGLRAAQEIRRRHPQTAVLMLSQDLQPAYAAQLLDVSQSAVGYLLKERVTDLRELADAARAVASGGTAFDQQLFESSQGERP